MNDTTKPIGKIRAKVINSDGSLAYDSGWINNTTTNKGKAVISGLAGNIGGYVAFSYLALGSDATAPSASQTALIAEISTNGLSRVSVTPTHVTSASPAITNDTLQLFNEWTVSGSSTINEAGIFNASGGGDGTTTNVMLCRALTTAISVISGQKFQLTYQYTVQ